MTHWAFELLEREEGAQPDTHGRFAWKKRCAEAKRPASGIQVRCSHAGICSAAAVRGLPCLRIQQQGGPGHRELGHPQQEHPADVLLRIRRRHPSRERELEEERAEPRRGEGLDEPVHHQGQRQASRVLAHLAHLLLK